MLPAWTHVKEIRDANLLITLCHNWTECANFEILDVSTGKAKPVFTNEEVTGGIS